MEAKIHSMHESVFILQLLPFQEHRERSIQNIFKAWVPYPLGLPFLFFLTGTGSRPYRAVHKEKTVQR